MPLMRVDLPAPLSPRSAMTSPRRTSKSTRYRAWTAPKAFEMPTASSRGVSAISGCPLLDPANATAGTRILARPGRHPLDAVGFSLLGVLHAEVRLGDVAHADLLDRAE